MAFQETDVFLREFGQPVSWGRFSGLGILDMPSEIIAGGMVLTTDYQLTVKTSDFPGIDAGQEVKVGSQSYYVREARLMDDGLFTTIYLSKQ